MQYVTLKANRVLNFLQQNFRHAPIKLKNTLYVSNVHPILEYARAAWDPAMKACAEVRKHVQKQTARFYRAVMISQNAFRIYY